MKPQSFIYMVCVAAFHQHEVYDMRWPPALCVHNINAIKLCLFLIFWFAPGCKITKSRKSPSIISEQQITTTQGIL